MTEEDINFLSAKDITIAHQVQSNSAQRAFHQLLLKPYWTRVWIIQELTAASNIIVFCGQHKLLWETLEKLSYTAFPAGPESEELRVRF